MNLFDNPTVFQLESYEILQLGETNPPFTYEILSTRSVKKFARGHATSKSQDHGPELKADAQPLSHPGVPKGLESFEGK